MPIQRLKSVNLLIVCPHQVLHQPRQASQHLQGKKEHGGFTWDLFYNWNSQSCQWLFVRGPVGWLRLFSFYCVLQMIIVSSGWCWWTVVIIAFVLTFFSFCVLNMTYIWCIKLSNQCFNLKFSVNIIIGVHVIECFNTNNNEV